MEIGRNNFARPPTLSSCKVSQGLLVFFFVHAYDFKGVNMIFYVLLSRTSVSVLKTYTYVFIRADTTVFPMRCIRKPGS